MDKTYVGAHEIVRLELGREKMFSDTHCHFRHHPYDAVEPTVHQMEKAGVELALLAGVSVDASKQEILTARRFDVLKACVGIHPWNADLYNAEALYRLKELAVNVEVVAFSEIGLDYQGRRDRVTAKMGAPPLEKAIQRTAFRAQLRAAKELNLPVIIHDNTPDQEVLNILDEEGNASVGAAIHGFDKDLAYAERCVDMGIYLSIGLVILAPEVVASTLPQPMRPIPEAMLVEREKKRRVVREVVQQLDLAWLLTETDHSNPEHVVMVAEQVAELKGLSREEVGVAATKNLRKLIKL